MRWLVIVLALLGLLGLYLYFFPESGDRLLNNLQNPDFTIKTDRVYKWRNERGEWQLTDTPPPPGVEYELSDYQDNVNVLPVPPGINQK